MAKLFALFILAAVVFTASAFQSFGVIAGIAAVAASVVSVVALSPRNRGWA